MNCVASSISSDHQRVLTLLSPQSYAQHEWSNLVSIADPHIQSAMGVGQADPAVNSVITFPVFFALLLSFGTIVKLITVFHPVRQAQDYLRWYLFAPMD